MVSCSKCRGFLSIISDDGKKMVLECSSCGRAMALHSPKKEGESSDPSVMFAGMT